MLLSLAPHFASWFMAVALVAVGLFRTVLLANTCLVAIVTMNSAGTPDAKKKSAGRHISEADVVQHVNQAFTGMLNNRQDETTSA